MAKPKRARHEYDPAVRAAVMAALLAGQSVSAVAREYSLPKGTVSDWRKKAAYQQEVGSEPTQKSGIGDLLVELIEANLRGMVAVAQVMQDATWVRKQPASELGTFVGITHDKTMRMLEAMDRAESPAP